MARLMATSSIMIALGVMATGLLSPIRPDAEAQKRCLAQTWQDTCKRDPRKAAGYVRLAAIGQYIAGMGFSNVGLGIVHSMAHPLSALYDTPHGVACATILPTVLEYNAEATGEKDVTLSPCAP